MKFRIIINFETDRRTYTPQVKKWWGWYTIGLFSTRPTLEDAEDMIDIYKRKYI